MQSNDVCFSNFVTSTFSHGETEVGGELSNPVEQRATTHCALAEAEQCFNLLFSQMSICSEVMLNAFNTTRPLSFRCQHFNVLDTCFREKSLMCLPSAIGRTAKTAYRRILLECTRLQQTVTQHKKKLQHRRKSATSLSGFRPTANSVPSELQFISLFGYLQTQCRRRPTSLQSRRTAGAEGEEKDNQQEYCSNAEMRELLASCETEVRQRSSVAQPMDIDRHLLLRIKLNASSKLLEYAKTRREEECLMVRAVLSDIFLIHQKYCLHTSVTRCVCQQLNLGTFCGINCAGLEALGLPFDQRLSWVVDFRGRLVGNFAWTSLSFMERWHYYVGAMLLTILTSKSLVTHIF